MSDTGDITFTKYFYDEVGRLTYTISGAERAVVEGITGITTDNIMTLTESDIAALLPAGVSVAVYDIASNQIDHVWNRSEAGEVSFTKYFYNADDELVYTVTGANRTEVEGVTGITIDNVATLSQAQVDAALLAGMSIAVYDIDENRVDHVWARTDDGDISYTAYNYDALGNLVYTVTGANRADVEGLIGVTIDTVATLTATEIDALLADGMSIAVYDIAC